MKPLSRVLALAACVAGSAQAALPLGLEGSWYNPPQSGHGLTIERIDPERALLFWHVFDPEGRPLTLYVEAALDGDRLVGEALAPTGMRFGSFDPAELELPVWGEVSLQFLDCNQAVLRYDAVAPGYGQGEIPLTRLLPSKDPHCSLTAAMDLQGLRSSTAFGDLHLPQSLHPDAHGTTVSGGVAANGDILLTASGEPFYVLRGQPVAAAPGRVELNWTVFGNTWANGLFGEAAERARPAGSLLQFRSALDLNEDGTRASSFLFAAEPGAGPHEFRLGFPSEQGWGLDEFRPGLYVNTVADPSRPVDDSASLQVVNMRLKEDGSLCLSFAHENTCRMRGRVTAVEGGTYDLELSALDPNEPGYQGKARFSFYSLPVIGRRHLLQLTASNGSRGLAFGGALREGGQ